MTDTQAVKEIARDIAFTGLVIPADATVRGVFRNGWTHKPFALFVEHADGSEWLYKRDGSRRPWLH